MKILVIEDDKRLNNIVGEYLRGENFEVYSAFDGEDALELFKDNAIDLVILDIMMPKLDGFSVCRRLRQKSDVLIIIVSARSDEFDKLLGFEFGADEYVEKPFSPKVLVARAKALLDRVHKTADSDIVRGSIIINVEQMSVKVEGESVSLTAKEFDMLSLLARHEGRVYTRDVLINEIWDYNYFGDGRIVDTNIKTLRKKLGLASIYIKTVVGKGYKFEVVES